MSLFPPYQSLEKCKPVLQGLIFLPGFHNAHSHDIMFLFVPGSKEAQSNFFIEFIY